MGNERFEELEERITGLESIEKPRSEVIINMSASVLRLLATTDAITALMLKYYARLGVSYDDLLQEFQDLYSLKYKKRIEGLEDDLGDGKAE